jgi:uncharacterized protein (DUF58 family)
MRAAAIILLLLAAYFRSGPLLFAVGVAVLLSLAAQWWLRSIGHALRANRTLESHLFFGESATVQLTIANRGRLPVPWLELHESLPGALVLPNVLSRVLSLGAQGSVTVEYTLRGRRRGLHSIGPLRLITGDVYGLARREWLLPTLHTLVVYPRLLAAHQLRLPALLLFGDARSRRPFLGDPARVSGIRPYSPGDPPHDVHWRATAATGTLQVKQYQPATTLQICLFLDLRRGAYQLPEAPAIAELAISIAATIGQWLIEQRQEVGLITNGKVLLSPEDGASQTEVPIMLTTPLPLTEPRDDLAAVFATAAPLPAAKGRGHLMRLLELLARVELNEQGEQLTQLLRHGFTLPWGATAVVITGLLDEEAFLTLHRLRQCGLLVVVFMVERPQQPAAYEERARALGITLQMAWQDEQFEAYAS